MRRTVRVALLAGLVVFLLRRRRATGPEEAVSIGFADGSSTTLEAGSPERELMLATAAAALA